MTYQQTLDYLYRCFPLFQQIGQKAYKEGLANTHQLDAFFEHPHRNYATIHVGGTNGKGSVSHSLAAILQAAGYRVGLYTSPHLLDFSERIRINGQPIEREYVVEFVRSNRPFFESLSPSFFELTTAMAFTYFAERQVDVAVIEVGLGGRLDCTNIITPSLSVITNISFDHTAILGNTLAKIASEKAGIIKSEVPVVIGETDPETAPVFISRAETVGASIWFSDAPETNPITAAVRNKDGRWEVRTAYLPSITLSLRGECQRNNASIILCAAERLIEQGFMITNKSLLTGLEQVEQLTGLRGRWEVLGQSPQVICDTGHNEAGIRQIVTQLSHESYSHLRIVLGVVNDKDISAILGLLPRSASYYFTQASVARALSADELYMLARSQGLLGASYPSVAEAYKEALRQSAPSDLIYIGGSTFVVADLLTAFNEKKI